MRDNNLKVDNRKLFKKKKILDVALQLFSEKGIEQTNMTDIAKESNVGVASLYRYFENKNNLVVETGIEAWRQINSKYKDDVDAIMSTGLKGIIKLENLLNLFYKIFTEERAFVCFLDGFDNYIVNNNVSADSLINYEKEVLKIDPYIQKVYKIGINDHSIKRIKDIDLFIRTIGHTLIALSQKVFIRNKIVTNDSKEKLLDEMKLMIQMIISYAKNKNK